MAIEKIIIREARESDLNDLVWISQETFYSSFAHVNTVSDIQDYLHSALNPTQIKDEFLNASSKFYLAYFIKELAGYMKINWPESHTERLEEDALELQRLYVLNKFQGQGIGQILFDEFIEIAKSEAFKLVWLGVWDGNPDAIRFYERNGMIPFGNHKFILGKDLQNDILMKKTL